MHHLPTYIMAICYISFGSNKGDRSKNVARALDSFRKHFTILDISSFYDTEPVYKTQNGNFLNAVIKVETDFTPVEVCEKVKLIETQLGKINVDRTEDKIIDIEFLYYGDKIVKNSPVIVPHHKAHTRKHILAAMAEISPEHVHPALGKTQKELLKELKCKKEVTAIPHA